MPKDSNEPSKALDADAMNAIRAMLVDEPPIAPLSSRNRPVSQGPRPSADGSIPHPQASTEAQTEAMPRRQSTMQADVPHVPQLELSLIDGIKEKIVNYRPTKRHLIFGGLILFALFRPGLLIGMVVLSIFIMVGVFLIFGYDGFWRNAMKLSRWYARRRPERAVELYGRIDNFAMRWDAILDRFPEGTVDGLYLPDFGEMAAADQKHEDAVERRLNTMRGS